MENQKKNAATQTGIIVGLIQGRHPLPVSEYIWNDPVDPVDMEGINAHALSWVKEHCQIEVKPAGFGINQAWGPDVEVYRGLHLTVFVTGLTACTAALIGACAINGVPLTLMHYDASCGAYVPQKIF